MPLEFNVRTKKQIRVIIDTDADCEADNPFAIAHALISPIRSLKMKKLMFVLSIFLMSCVSVPLTPDGESLDGIWVRDDGAYFTFRGKNWEVVDMVNGAAGYGIFKFDKKGRMQFTNTDIANLKFPIKREYGFYISEKKITRVSGVVVKQFQINAQEDFSKLYPKRILSFDPEKKWDYTTSSHGGNLINYNLEGNTLTLDKIYENPNGSQYFTLPFTGTFIKQ